MKEPMIPLNKPPYLTGQNVEQKRAEIKTYFQQTWAVYESLFDLLNQEQAYFLRPEPLRHPLIFYYGHTAVFYVNKLILGKFIHQRINPHMESICAVGVDEMSWDDLKPDNYQWPSLQQVRDYRQQVKQLLLGLIDDMPLQLPITQDSLAWLVLMGCEHERIHIETSSVIMRMLDLQYLTATDHWQNCTQQGQAPDNQLLAVSGQTITLGKPETNATYGWDNEYGQLTVEVDDFKASQYLVSNAEFMQFIQAGGYKIPEYWTEEGQQWLAFTQAQMPRFWVLREDKYYQRNLLSEQPLPLNWPVEVNYLEAKAFCEWKTQSGQQYTRLPTEGEWQLLRNQLETDLPDWSVAPGNINLEHFASSCPVDHFAQGDFYDIIGNVWQWTESPIDGYEGFTVHPLYDDFSTPTFDGQHNLIKGGSWASTGNEASRDSRYAFRRHFFQHAGFRYIQSSSATIPITPVQQFEVQADISRMLHRHYQETTDLQEIISLCLAHQPQQNKVLDLGCGVGRLSFELAKYFKQVEGIDLTARHIQHALAMKEKGQVRYALPTEGQLVDYYEVSLMDLELEEVGQQINFIQGDAHNLKPQFTDYDVIICHQLLEHLYNPAHFLKQIQSRLQAGGLLLISSAYQWDSNKTPVDKWLGGFKQDGENLTSFDGLQQHLSAMTLLAEHPITVTKTLNSRHRIVLDNQLTIWQKA